jgi:hypothetical protein
MAAWAQQQNSPYAQNSPLGEGVSNMGIGQDWFANKDKWTPNIAPGENSFSAADNAYGKDYTDQLRGMAGYQYQGKDGQDYWINQNTRRNNVDQESQATNAQDYLFGGASGQGRADGEKSYGVTRYNPDFKGDGSAYNGYMFDAYDKDGKFVGNRMSYTDGDKGFQKMGVMSALAMLGLGAAGGLFGGAAGGLGGSGAGFVGEGAASGIGAWDGALAGASSGSAALGGAGAAGGAIDLGGGLGMGADGAITGATPGAASGLTNAGIMESVGAGAGSAGAGAGTGLKNLLGKELFSVPGLGGVTGSNLLQLAVPLLGALGGSQGTQNTQTQTRELPDYLKGPVAGPGGLIDQAGGLMNQQLNGSTPPGLLNNLKKAKRRYRYGLL